MREPVNAATGQLWSIPIQNANTQQKCAHGWEDCWRQTLRGGEKQSRRLRKSRGERRLSGSGEPKGGRGWRENGLLCIWSSGSVPELLFKSS